MKTLPTLLLACLVASCGSKSAEDWWVNQKIPVQVQKGKTTEFEIKSVSGNGWNEVGIRCSSEVWKSLTNGTTKYTVRLKSSNKKGTEVMGLYVGSGPVGAINQITNVHYLFLIGGKSGANAQIELKFPGGPAEATPAEIIVAVTPADTGP